MTELLVRSALPSLDETVLLQELRNLPWLEDRDGAHALGNLHLMHSNQLRFQFRLTFFKEHRYNFLEILLKLIHVCALRMSSGPTWNVADKYSSVGVAFNDNIVRFHDIPRPFYLSKQHQAGSFYLCRDYHAATLAQNPLILCQGSDYRILAPTVERAQQTVGTKRSWGCAASEASPIDPRGPIPLAATTLLTLFNPSLRQSVFDEPIEKRLALVGKAKFINGLTQPVEYNVLASGRPSKAHAPICVNERMRQCTSGRPIPVNVWRRRDCS